METYLHKPIEILQILSRSKILKCLTSKYFSIFINKPTANFVAHIAIDFINKFHDAIECIKESGSVLNTKSVEMSLGLHVTPGYYGVCSTDNFWSVKFSPFLQILEHVKLWVNDESKIKNATLCFHVLFWHFVVAFHNKTCIFIIFISVFDKYQIYATESETGIGDQKLSVELYVTMWY